MSGNTLSAKASILLAEDDNDIAEMLVDALLDEGYNVHQCDSGQQALDFLKQHDVDVFISDIMMPEMDGLELMESLRACSKWFQLPIIFITAGMLPEEAQEDPWILSLAKPFIIDQLFNLVSTMIQRRARAKSQPLYT